MLHLRGRKLCRYGFDCVCNMRRGDLRARRIEFMHELFGGTLFDHFQLECVRSLREWLVFGDRRIRVFE